MGDGRSEYGEWTRTRWSKHGPLGITVELDEKTGALKFLGYRSAFKRGGTLQPDEARALLVFLQENIPREPSPTPPP